MIEKKFANFLLIFKQIFLNSFIKHNLYFNKHYMQTFFTINRVFSVNSNEPTITTPSTDEETTPSKEIEICPAPLVSENLCSRYKEEK